MNNKVSRTVIIVAFLVFSILTISVMVYRNIYGWPPSNCDFLKQKYSNQDIGDPRIECTLGELRRSPSPDIRLCFKPWFGGIDYPTTLCAMKVALKTSDYTNCEKIKQITNTESYKWECIGRVAHKRMEKDKCANAPDYILRDLCNRVSNGEPAYLTPFYIEPSDDL